MRLLALHDSITGVPYPGVVSKFQGKGEGTPLILSMSRQSFSELFPRKVQSFPKRRIQVQSFSESVIRARFFKSMEYYKVLEDQKGE